MQPFILPAFAQAAMAEFKEKVIHCCCALFLLLAAHCLPCCLPPAFCLLDRSGVFSFPCSFGHSGHRRLSKASRVGMRRAVARVLSSLPWHWPFGEAASVSCSSR
jgi:hypothetical protein